VDGLRGDLLKHFVDTAPSEFPNFVRLRDAGAFTYQARCDYDYSITNPNHICMVTGRPVAQQPGFPNTLHHGITNNGGLPTAIHLIGNLNIPYKASIFDVVHDHGLSTALYVNKTKLGLFDLSYNATYGANDIVGPNNGPDKIDFALVQELNTSAAIATLTQRIKGNLENFTFFHFAEADYAGHSYGWVDTVGSPYRNAIKTVDGYLGTIFQALDSQPSLVGKVAILLTADHGGRSDGDHGYPAFPENYTIPFFLTAPGVPLKCDLYSIFLNRTYPGTTRPSYAASAQPIRNGDLANLAAALLRLPTVPGSLMIPQLKKLDSLDPPLIPTPDGPPTLAIHRARDRVVLSWPRYMIGWTLETTTDLTNGPWQKITSGIAKFEDTYSYVCGIRGPQQFFRLHKATTP
jgi:hypothetical protein